MNEKFECPTHGHMYRRALDEAGKLVSLAEALQRKRELFYCHNDKCGVRVAPEADTPIRALAHVRSGHFNEVPEAVTRYSGPKYTAYASNGTCTLKTVLRLVRMCPS